MKTLSVTIPLDDDEAALLLTKYTAKELEGIVIREGLHVLFALANDIKNNSPYIEPLEAVEE